MRIVPARFEAEAAKDAPHPPDIDERVVADQAIAPEDRPVLLECRRGIDPLARRLLTEKPARPIDEAVGDIDAFLARIGCDLLVHTMLRHDLEGAIAERGHQVELRLHGVEREASVPRSTGIWGATAPRAARRRTACRALRCRPS